MLVLAVIIPTPTLACLSVISVLIESFKLLAPEELKKVSVLVEVRELLIRLAVNIFEYEVPVSALKTSRICQVLEEATQRI